MTSRSANFPRAVVDRAGALAAHYGVSRRAVYLAACRAVVAAPPPGEVAYPTLDRAVGNVEVPMPAAVRDAVVIVERRHFYGRFAWLCFYGMVKRVDGLAAALVAAAGPDSEALARQDAAAYERTNGGQPCLPPTARAPVNKRPRAKRG